MSSVSESAASSPAGRSSWWFRVDGWLERAGEKLNPILVKEARQALKSRQFVVTFTLLLLCALTWTMLGVAILMPGIYYSPSGPFMLTGYYCILSVPMLLVVPFSAYRSLANEREDGTYELLSITALSSRHIVTGKLGSAVLQMLLYYSVLSPCIAFTYLLRGIDIVTILTMLAHLFWVSVLMSSIGLVVATLSRLRHVQVLFSVALVIGLLFVTFGWWTWTNVLVNEGIGPMLTAGETWIIQAALVSMGISYVVLFLFAAAANLSFSSDNRSTPIRIALVAQQALFFGWMTYFFLDSRSDDPLFFLLSFSAGQWMVAGAMLTGEWPELSPRVRRSLPQSFLGRCFLTWFNPGSGTGYVFAVANLGALTFLTVTMAAVGGLFLLSRNTEQLVLFGFFLWCYLTIYLGIGRLILMWLRRFVQVSFVLPLIVHALLLAIGAAVPFFVQSWFFGFRVTNQYGPLQVMNWAWTLAEVVDRNIGAATVAVVPVAIIAALLLLVNLTTAAREVEQVRQEAPARVQSDDLQRRPPKRPAPKRPTSPFEDE